jgi:hypothetical protein
LKATPFGHDNNAEADRWIEDFALANLLENKA